MSNSEVVMQIPDRDDILKARSRIAPHVRRTPVMTVPDLWTRGIEVKLENTQVTGTFKARGAFNTLLSVRVPPAGIVAASGGNHGVAVAHAAKALGRRATIFVPEIAGPERIALIRRTGADLKVVAGAYGDALEKARTFEADSRAMQIHAYDAFGTVAGQGTLFAEWDDQGLQADTILIAVGGGGLIGGALAWAGASRKIVAVEPELAPTLSRALADGPETEVAVAGIAASSLGARKIGRLCYDQVRRLGTETVLVDEAAIAEAQRALWDGLRQYVEPAGAVALSALRSGAYTPAPDERVAVLICGANPAPGPFAETAG